MDGRKQRPGLFLRLQEAAFYAPPVLRPDTAALLLSVDGRRVMPTHGPRHGSQLVAFMHSGRLVAPMHGRSGTLEVPGKARLGKDHPAVVLARGDVHALDAGSSRR